MVELHVRGLPAELHERLRQQAAAEGRSMSAQAVVLLRQALEERHRPAAQRAAVEQLRDIRSRSALPDRLPPAEQLVREDRDATG